MSKPLLIGIAAGLSLACAAMVAWFTVPVPAIPADDGGDLRTEVEGFGSQASKPGGMDVVRDASRNSSSGGQSQSPREAHGEFRLAEDGLLIRSETNQPAEAGQHKVPHAEERSAERGASVFQMTASRQRVAGESVPHGRQAQDGMPEDSPDQAEAQALGPIFFEGDREDHIQDPAIQVPLAQLTPDPAIDWNEQAVAALKALRERFAKAIAADRLDPANPEYAERWRKAQPANDDSYRLMFGQAAFDAKQLDAARNAQLQAEKEAAAPAN